MRDREPGVAATDSDPDRAFGKRPDQLGEYQIVREIGRGGMGVVYEAVQQSLGRHVALKVLPWSSPGSGSCVDRFKLEARAAARLHHTNIVPVYGVGEHEGTHYFAMQYIEGQSLDVIVEEVRRLRGGATCANRHPAGLANADARTRSLARGVAEGLITGRFTQAMELLSGRTSRRSPIGLSQALPMGPH